MVSMIRVNIIIAEHVNMLHVTIVIMSMLAC